MAFMQKLGDTQGVIIPDNILKLVNLNVTDEINLTVENGKIIISKKNTLDDLFANYKESYKSEEIDFGEPVGDEEW